MDKIPWWEKWGYVTRCPNCDSRRIEEQGKYRYTYRKDKKEEQLYICKICKTEFWA